MQPIKGYEEATTFSSQEKLPVGGYVLKIIGVKIEENEYGKKLLIQYEINEGEYAGFFKKQYNASNLEDKKYKGIARIAIPGESEENDNKLRAFKTFIENVKTSNPGYMWNWSEQTLVGKLFGGIFGEKEYFFDGKSGYFVTYKFSDTIENIRKGNYKIPEPLKLSAKQTVNAMTEVEDGGELPF